MKKHKVIFFDHTPFVGGAQLALARHLNFLDLSVFEPVVICSDIELIVNRLDKERATQVRFIEYSFPKLKIFSFLLITNFVFASAVILKIVRREKPDLLVINTERCLYTIILSILLYRTKSVIFVRDYEFSKVFLHILRPLISKFICVSQSIRDFYFGSSSEKNSVIYVGTDLNSRLRNLNDGEVETLRQKYDLREAFLIGFVGRLVAWKGPLILIDIAKELSQIKDLPTWKIIVVGEGSYQENSVENELKKRIHEEGLEKFFLLVGFYERVDPWYKIFSVLLHTSLKREPFATVIIEALSASIPVIATDLGGTKEVITDGENGLLVNPRPTEFSKSILELMKNPVLYKRLKIGASNSSIKFKESDITKEIEKVYLEVLTKHGHSGLDPESIQLTL